MNRDKKFCPNCGEQLNFEDKFCQKCGFNFETREFTKSEENKVETKDNNKKNMQLGLIGGVILLLFVVVYFVINKNTVSIAGTYMPEDNHPDDSLVLEISSDGKTKLSGDETDLTMEYNFYIKPLDNNTYIMDGEKKGDFEFSIPTYDKTDEALEYLNDFKYDLEETLAAYDVTIEINNGKGILSGGFSIEDLMESDEYTSDEFELREFNGTLYMGDLVLIKQ